MTDIVCIEWKRAASVRQGRQGKAENYSLSNVVFPLPLSPMRATETASVRPAVVDNTFAPGCTGIATAALDAGSARYWKFSKREVSAQRGSLVRARASSGRFCEWPSGDVDLVHFSSDDQNLHTTSCEQLFTELFTLCCLCSTWAHTDAGTSANP